MTKTTNKTPWNAKASAAKFAKAAARRRPGNVNSAGDLSDTILVALSAASQREEGTITVPETLENEAIATLAASLIDLGLAEEIPAGRGQPVWRQDEANGQANTLRITGHALTILGIDEGNAANGIGDIDLVGPARRAPTQSDAGNRGRNGAVPPKAEGKVRQTAAGVSQAHSTGVQSPSAEPPQPRKGNKQGQLIAMLSREEGVSLVEIATALGWLPHTTRAALTGLRHKGYELAREINSERGSLYRIMAMPITRPAVTDAAQAEAA
jgi:hypothetical protein